MIFPKNPSNFSKNEKWKKLKQNNIAPSSKFQHFTFQKKRKKFTFQPYLKVPDKYEVGNTSMCTDHQHSLHEASHNILHTNWHYCSVSTSCHHYG